MPSNPLSAAFLALLLAAPVFSAQIGPCPQAAQAAIGRKARVTLASGEVQSGKILRADSGALILGSGGRETTLEAAAIDRIELRSRSKTLRNILLSAGAGALAGALFGAAADEADSDSLAILFAMIGAGGGAGVGAALPARTIICD